MTVGVTTYTVSSPYIDDTKINTIPEPSYNEAESMERDVEITNFATPLLHIVGLTRRQVDAISSDAIVALYLLNDDITPMDFVQLLLRDVFEKDAEQAFSIMEKAHNADRSLIATALFPELKQQALSAMRIAQVEGYALSFAIEMEQEKK